jgi:hypothetical protein
MLGNTFTLEDLEQVMAQPQTPAALRARVAWGRKFAPSQGRGWRLGHPSTPRVASRGPARRLDQQWAAFQVGYATQGIGEFLPHELVAEDEMATIDNDTKPVMSPWERGIKVPRVAVSSPTVSLADLAQEPEPEKKGGLVAALPYIALAIAGFWLISSFVRKSKTSFE